MVEKYFNSNSFLKISTSSLFPKFLHDCCDEIIDSKPVDIKNYNNDIEWTTEDIITTKRAIQEFFRNCTIKETFEIAEDVSETAQNALKECYEIRKDDIEQHLVKESYLNAGHNLVENIDWKLKWILGSSKLAGIREPVLQLDLGCVQKGPEDSKRKENIVNFELNLEQVDELISILENIKSELDYTKL